MDFFEQLDRAKEILRSQRRVSQRALRRGLDCSEEDLEEIVEELVEIQQVARREGRALVWADGNVSRESLHNDAEPASAWEPAPASYTPRHLAEKILAIRSAIEGERKHVTVLFCDVVRSMDLAEALGPERWHALLQDLFQILTRVVHAYEGTVNQYTGDGLMALFGAPIANENHARHACVAALEILSEMEGLARRAQARYGVEVAMRIGLNSGDVVVGCIGDDLRMDYTAQGQVVGIAARMEALAEPGEAYLSQFTANEVEDYFDLRDLGATDVKGVSHPMQVFVLGKASSERTRFDVSRKHGLTRFIGREADMETLRLALQHAKAGNGQVVGVVAEAGTGKSRLCYEFLRQCRAQGMTVIEGHAVSHGKNLPFLPMLQIFRDYYGISEADDDRTAREKIAGRLLLLDEHFREVLPVVFEFFGVSDPDAAPLRIDPEAKQRQLLSVLRQIVRGADPAVSDMVAYLEDLHWLDPGSEMFLQHWVDALAGTNSFLLVNFRPEYQADWMHKSYYRQIPLAPLNQAEVRQMLAALLGAEPSVEGLAEIIFQRTGGNPFFCEEVVKSLEESGMLQGQTGNYVLTESLADLEIPASVQSVLAARIDRLSDDQKTTLQAAAVIGRVFPRSLIARVVGLPDATLDFCLDDLKKAEFIHLLGSGSGTEFIFKHALTQEVALNSQLHEKRSQVHAAVARAVEDLSGRDAEKQAALIAQHWEQAGESLIAATWYLRAADYIAAADARLGAHYLTRTLALTEPLAGSDQRDQLRLQAGSALVVRVGWLGDMRRERLQALYEETMLLADKTGDPASRFLAKSMYAVSVGASFGDVQMWGEMIDQAFAEASAIGLPLRYEVAASKAYSLYARGMLIEIQNWLAEFISVHGDDYEVGREIAGFSQLSVLQQLAMIGLAYRGEVRDALQKMVSLCEITWELGLVEEWIWAFQAVAIIRHLAGGHGGFDRDEDYSVHLDRLEDAIEKRASMFSRTIGLHAKYLHLSGQGQLQAAAQSLEEALRVSRENSAYQEAYGWLLSDFAEILLAMGETEAALQKARESVQYAEGRGTLLYEAHAEIALARVLLEQGQRSAAKEIAAALDVVEGCVEQSGARVFLPQVLELRGRLAAMEGDPCSSQRQLQAAQAQYAKMNAAGHAERLAEELGR